MLKKVNVTGLVNITGGGIPDNFERIVPNNCAVAINLSTVPKLPIFDFLQNNNPLPNDERLRTFNNGVGFATVVREEDADATIASFKNSGISAFQMGEIVNRTNKAVIY